MPDLDEKSQIRELPISLQGIETILVYLNDRDKKLSSIRNISANTGLSMRVVKNVLLQLEKFNQVTRITEKNNILPKWKITKFGKRVLKEAKGIEKVIKFPSREDELIHGVKIPNDFERLKVLLKETKETLAKELSSLRVELSKVLGPILETNNPIFEDMISFAIKRAKYLKQRILNLPVDPTATLILKKIGEKQKKVSKQEMTLMLVEIYFFNLLILNQLKRTSEFALKLTQYIDNEAMSNGYSVAKDLRDEIRIVSRLFDQREKISANSHVLSESALRNVSKNKITSEILDGIIEIPVNIDVQNNEIESVVVKLLAILEKGEKQLEGHNYEITDIIPLFALYNLILDEKPGLTLTIDQLEKTINSLADKGYIPGIKTIQEDEDHYYKVVQLKAHDILEDESHVVSIAIRLQNFMLADIIEETGWVAEKVIGILNRLTKLGIFKHSKSFLHGEQWYVISEKNT